MAPIRPRELETWLPPSCGAGGGSAIARATETEHMNVEAASARLASYARVQVLAFDDALARAQELLGIREQKKAA